MHSSVPPVLSVTLLTAYITEHHLQTCPSPQSFEDLSQLTTWGKACSNHSGLKKQMLPPVAKSCFRSKNGWTDSNRRLHHVVSKKHFEFTCFTSRAKSAVFGPVVAASVWWHHQSPRWCVEGHKFIRKMHLTTAYSNGISLPNYALDCGPDIC